MPQISSENEGSEELWITSKLRLMHRCRWGRRMSMIVRTRAPSWGSLITSSLSLRRIWTSMGWLRDNSRWERNCDGDEGDKSTKTKRRVQNMGTVDITSCQCVHTDARLYGNTAGSIRSSNAHKSMSRWEYGATSCTGV
jgi:hypothetical protein